MIKRYNVTELWKHGQLIGDSWDAFVSDFRTKIRSGSKEFDIYLHTSELERGQIYVDVDDTGVGDVDA